MMVLLLLLNLNLVSLLIMDVHIAMMLIAMMVLMSRILFLHTIRDPLRNAMLMDASTSGINVNTIMGDMADFMDMVLGMTVKEDMAVRVVIALTAVQPTIAVIRRRRWANRGEVVGERSSNMVEGG